MIIEKIIVTADFLRQPDRIPEKSDVARNVIWLKSLFGDLLKEISNLPIVTLFDEMNEFKIKLYDAYRINQPYKSNDWHKVFFSDEILPEVKDMFKEYYQNSLVVGVELPVIFLNYFNELNIPYINIIVHPIRYMDDLALGIATNSKPVYDKLAQYQVNTDLFKIQATYIKTSQRMRNKNNLVKNSCIIFGQTKEDISILKNDNSLDTLLNYKEEISQLNNKYNHIYFKPHPYNPDNAEVISFLGSICNNFSVINNMSAYNLYSDENVSLCISLSSGSLYEAKYFGKDIKYLFKPPYLYGENFIGQDLEKGKYKDIHITVYKDFLTYNFWSDILSPIMKTNQKAQISIASNNIFRYVLNATWSFDDNKSVSVEKYINAQKESLKTKRNKIFSINNEYLNNVKHKVITILGIKIKIKSLNL